MVFMMGKKVHETDGHSLLYHTHSNDKYYLDHHITMVQTLFHVLVYLQPLFWEPPSFKKQIIINQTQTLGKPLTIKQDLQ